MVDKEVTMAKPLSLSICLKPDDDFPHPRYLCFRYPFGKSSPKSHCNKCYCYVCQEVAPCKKWDKHPKGHCHATAKDNEWRLLRQHNKIMYPFSTRTMAHHKLTVSFMFDPPGQLIKGFAGGVLRNGYDDWIIGFAMRIVNETGTHDCSILSMTALLEGLQLAWSKGFRCLEIQLGFVFHDGFWYDFTKDAMTGKFRLRVDRSSICHHQSWDILKSVEDYLNKEWYVDVKNCHPIKEEACAFAMAAIGNCQSEDKQIYDFSTWFYTPHIMQEARNLESSLQTCFLNYLCSQHGLGMRGSKGVDDGTAARVKIQDVHKVEEADECSILEFDPTENLNLSNLSLCEKESEAVTEEEISILAEKGQVACRDYPHPRHLCVKYPYKKTSHDMHCVMCYCYVCDIPVPCKQWADGAIGLKHCDATDEIHMWRELRALKKQGRTVSQIAYGENTEDSGSNW